VCVAAAEQVVDQQDKGREVRGGHHEGQAQRQQAAPGEVRPRRSRRRGPAAVPPRPKGRIQLGPMVELRREPRYGTSAASTASCPGHSGSSCVSSVVAREPGRDRRVGSRPSDSIAVIRQRSADRSRWRPSAPSPRR
jgi:hypothetical protein